MHSEFEAHAGAFMLDKAGLAASLEQAAGTVQFVWPEERAKACSAVLAGVPDGSLFSVGEVNVKCEAIVKALRNAPVDFSTPKPPLVVKVDTTKSDSNRRSFTVSRR